MRHANFNSCPASIRQHLPLSSGSSSLAGGSGGRAGSPVGTVSIPAGVGSSTAGSRGSESTGGLPVSTSVGEASVDGSGTDLSGARNLSLLLDLLGLLGLRVAVEVQIGDDLPGGLTVGDGAAEAEDLTGEQPPDETDGVATLVVGRDGNVDELGGGVGVAESDNGDVNVGSLLDGLSVGAGVGDDDETGLLERAGDVVGEVTGGEATGNGDGTGVSGELEDGALTVGTSRDDTDVGRVVDGSDDAGSEDNLLPNVALKSVLFDRVLSLPGLSYQVLPMLITLIPSGRVFQR